MGKISSWRVDCPRTTPHLQERHQQSTKNVLEHLADLGLHPDDITILICSHFDVDHAGSHDAFAQAELIVQRAHDELARSRLNTYIGDTRGKIAILLEARRWLHVSYLLPQMLPLDFRKDEATL